MAPEGSSESWLESPGGFPALPLPHSPSAPDPQRCLDDLLESRVLSLWGHGYCRDGDSTGCSGVTQLPTASRPPPLLSGLAFLIWKGEQERLTPEGLG